MTTRKRICQWCGKDWTGKPERFTREWDERPQCAAEEACSLRARLAKKASNARRSRNCSGKEFSAWLRNQRKFMRIGVVTASCQEA